jgi:parallel beta-helix repeat protein
MIALIGVLCLPLLSSATTLYVGLGETYTTIQSAVDAAVEGDTIIVRDGVYNENVVINKASLCVKSEHGRENCTVIAANPDADAISIYWKNNCTVEGFTVYGATSWRGIRVAGSNCQVLDNRVGLDATHNNQKGIQLSGQAGIISGNLIEWNTDNGLEIYDLTSNHCIITNNRSNYNRRGIYLVGSYHEVRDNSCFNNAEFGFDLRGTSRYNIVSENDFSQNSGGIQLWHGFNLISSNHCNQNSVDGIYINQAHSNSLVYNECIGNGQSGIVGNWSQNNLITANRSNSNSGNGIKIQSRYKENAFFNEVRGNLTGEVSAMSDNLVHWQSPTQFYYVFDGDSYQNFLGNYYGDDEHTDADMDGIVDDYYILPGDGGLDFHPLADTLEAYELKGWWFGRDSVLYEGDLATAPGPVAVASGLPIVWTGAEPVSSSLFFTGEDTWTGRLAFVDAPAAGTQFQIDVGSYNPASAAFTPSGLDALVTFNGYTGDTTYVTDAQAFTVVPGNYLAVRIQNVTTGSSCDLLTGGAWTYINVGTDAGAEIETDTIYVGTDEIIKSISDALAFVDNEGVIILRDGIYNESIEIYKSVELRSENGYENCTIVTPDSTKHIITIYADSVTIQGFTLYGATRGNNRAAVFIETPAQGCLIQGNRFGIDTDHCNDNGIILWESRHNLLSNNFCNANRRAGFYLYRSSDNQILSNHCVDNKWGLWLETGSRSNQIEGNWIGQNSQAGIYLSGNAALSTVKGNTVYENTQGIFIDYSSSHLVVANVCSTNVENGILLDHSSYCSIVANDIIDNQEYGLRLYGSECVGNQVVRNLCSGNGYHGIQMWASHSNSVYLNDLINNGGSSVGSGNNAVNRWISPAPLTYSVEWKQTGQNFLGNYHGELVYPDNDGDGIYDNPFALPGTEPADAFPLLTSQQAYSVDIYFLCPEYEFSSLFIDNPAGIVHVGTDSAVIWTNCFENAFAVEYSGDDSWNGQLTFTESPAASQRFKVEIGYSEDQFDFTPGGPEAILEFNGATRDTVFSTTALAFMQPAGTYLALRLTNLNNAIAYDLLTGGVWSFLVPVTQSQVAVDEPADNTLPKSYTLLPLYPNPFNPVTTVRFQLPEKGLVSLQVFDIQGCLVTELLNKIKTAGEYAFSWDAGQLSSGVYFVRMEAGAFQAFQKCVLLK